MSDCEFALAILDLMPQDNEWHSFVSGLRKKVCKADDRGTPIDSTSFIIEICDEDWFHNKDDHLSSSVMP
jgi:hypothetical protein